MPAFTDRLGILLCVFVRVTVYLIPLQSLICFLLVNRKEFTCNEMCYINEFAMAGCHHIALKYPISLLPVLIFTLQIKSRVRALRCSILT